MARSIKVNALMSGLRQVSVAIFPLITIPYITRVIGADSYGMVNYSASIVQYFSLLAGLGISTYAIREGAAVRDDKEAFARFASEMFSLNVLTSAASLCLLAIFLAFFDGMADYRLLMAVQALTIVTNAVGIDWVNSACEDFVYLTLRYVLFQIVAVVCMFIFVHGPGDYVVYALLSNLSTLLGGICNVFYIRRYVHVRFTLKLNLRAHIKPILTLFGNSVSQTLYLTANTTILGALTTNYAVGLFSVPSKIYSMVKGVLNSVTLVVVPRVSAYVGKGELCQASELLGKTVDTLLVVCVPSMVGLVVLADDIVVLLAGEEYASGGYLLRLLAVALMFSTLANIFANSVLIPLRKEKVVLRATLVAGIASVLTSLLSIPVIGAAGAALATLISEFIVLSMCLAASRGLIRVSPSAGNLLQVGLSSVAIVALCLAIQHLVTSLLLRVVVSVAVSVFAYGVLLLALGNTVVKNVASSMLTRMK